MMDARLILPNLGGPAARPLAAPMSDAPVTIDIEDLDELIRTHEALLHGLRRLRQQLMPDDDPLDGKSDPLLSDLPFTTRTLHCLAGREAYRLVNPDEPVTAGRVVYVAAEGGKRIEYERYPAPLIRLSEVAAMSRAELLRLPNFGKASYQETYNICVQHGFWRAGDVRRDPKRWRYG